MAIVNGSLLVDSLVNGQQYTLKSNVGLNVYNAAGDTFLFSVGSIGSVFVSDGNDLLLKTNDVAVVSLTLGDQRDFEAVFTAISADLTITVGTGGDYDTINDALLALTAKYPLYKFGGVNAEIKLLSGFVMAEQVSVVGNDLSWVTITSEDAEVTVDRSALIEIAGTRPVFYGDYATLPRISCLFSIDTSGVASSQLGVFLENLSQVSVDAACGFKNGVLANLYAFRGSRANIEDGVFTGATTYGVIADRGSDVNAKGADAGSSGTGFTVLGGGTLNAAGGTGSVSQTVNTLTANGIIFQ